MARAKKTRVVDEEWRRRPLPEVDERRCTGCGWCVAVCPTSALAMANSLPWLHKPAVCVSCALCAAVCPTQSLKMAEKA
jgi:NAD-dependent dihydropyrimidine dehydrogenase PreA subunit